MTSTANPPLLGTLQTRFEQHMHRHAGLAWSAVAARLKGNLAALQTLQAMEDTGGEPDVIGRDSATGEYLLVDCAAESPPGRRSLCYDREALNARKDHAPASSALDRATEMGIALLTESQYQALQQLGEFDTKTSSWLHTPADVRARGGALFGDRRYGRVFVYHNGAPSYYAVRGFRGMLRV